MKVNLTSTCAQFWVQFGVLADKPGDLLATPARLHVPESHAPRASFWEWTYRGLSPGACVESSEYADCNLPYLPQATASQGRRRCKMSLSLSTPFRALAISSVPRASQTAPITIGQGPRLIPVLACSILLAIKKLRRSPEKHVRWVYGAVSFCFAVRR